MGNYTQIFNLCDGLNLQYMPRLKRNRWTLLIFAIDKEEPYFVPLNEKQIRKIIPNLKRAINRADSLQKRKDFLERLDVLGEAVAQDLNESLNP